MTTTASRQDAVQSLDSDSPSRLAVRVDGAHKAFGPRVVFDDFRLDIREREFVALHTRMSWAEDQNGRGTLLATLAIISDQECRRLVQLVCDVHCGIEGELSALQSSRLHEAHMRLDALLGPLPGLLDEEWDVPLCERKGSG